MYKVFIREEPVFICNSDQIKAESAELKIIHFEINFDWSSIIDNPPRGGVYVIGDNIDLIWSSFKGCFQEIAAAGGVVENSNKEILCIFRNGKWDLPKGKVEDEEEIADAAIREVEEECGLERLKIVKHVQNTYHTYEIKGVHVLKTTYWYSMKTASNKRLTPQLEEGITKAEWVKNDDLKKVKANTYKSILELLT